MSKLSPGTRVEFAPHKNDPQHLKGTVMSDFKYRVENFNYHNPAPRLLRHPILFYYWANEWLYAAWPSEKRENSSVYVRWDGGSVEDCNGYRAEDLVTIETP